MVNRRYIHEATVLLLLLVLSYFPLFYQLDKAPIGMWDEATYANNAIDMLHNRNFFVAEHMGQPDWYNTKPTLVIALQALSMQLFGINEFTVRLPSAIFGLLTVLLVYFFSVRVIGSRLVGLISAGILLSSAGYVGSHVVRTGDLDAALVFWLCLGLFVLIDLVIKKPADSRLHYLLLAAAFTFGFLTKGIAGFFFGPFMLIIALLFYNRKKLFSDRYLYYAGVLTVVLCSGYYFIRNLYTPGYFQAVLDLEIMRFSKGLMSWQAHPFDWYYQQLKATRFYPFTYALPLSVVGLFVFKGDKFRVLVSLMITAAGYFLLISYPADKLAWYDAPLFPVMAVLIGFSFVELGMWVSDKLKIKGKGMVKTTLMAVLALVFLVKPYRSVISGIQDTETALFPMVMEGAALKYLHENAPEIKKLTVYKKEEHEEHYDQLLFYVRAFEEEHGYQIRMTREMKFKSGEMVLVFREEDKVFIQQQYKAVPLRSWKGVVLFRIPGVI